MIKQTQFETISDERGEIKKIAQNVDVLSISSKAGSKRAGHFHRSSSHLCKLINGKMLYYERPADSQVCPILLEINPGEYFFSDKLQEHLMVFLMDSVFDCYSFGARDKESYETDLVRLNHDLQDIYDSFPYKNG